MMLTDCLKDSWEAQPVFCQMEASPTQLDFSAFRELENEYSQVLYLEIPFININRWSKDENYFL